MQEKIDSSQIGPAQASLFRSSDQIREDLQELISANDLIEPKEINVRVENGIVTLQGRVRDRVACDEAIQAARSVLGVIDVKSELEIRG